MPFCHLLEAAMDARDYNCPASRFKENKNGQISQFFDFEEVGIVVEDVARGATQNYLARAL